MDREKAEQAERDAPLGKVEWLNRHKRANPSVTLSDAVAAYERAMDSIGVNVDSPTPERDAYEALRRVEIATRPAGLGGVAMSRHNGHKPSHAHDWAVAEFAYTPEAEAARRVRLTWACGRRGCLELVDQFLAVRRPSKSAKATRQRQTLAKAGGGIVPVSLDHTWPAPRAGFPGLVETAAGFERGA